MFIVIITIHVFIIIAAIVITFDVYWGGDWLGLGGTRREPEAMSSEGQDREPRLNDDVLNSAIVIMLMNDDQYNNFDDYDDVCLCIFP